MADKFPFAFDLEQIKDAFKVPAFDFTAIQDAHTKNVTALVEANNAALSGYRALYERQAALFDAAMVETRERMGAMQAKPVSVETAHENYETVKAAFEKALGELRELAEMAQGANTQAFEIVKARAEDAMAEMKDAAEKLAA